MGCWRLSLWGRIRRLLPLVGWWGDRFAADRMFLGGDVMVRRGFAAVLGFLLLVAGVSPVPVAAGVRASVPARVSVVASAGAPVNS